MIRSEIPLRPGAICLTLLLAAQDGVADGRGGDSRFGVRVTERVGGSRFGVELLMLVI